MMGLPRAEETMTIC